VSDPRIKKFFAAMPAPVEKSNVLSREELLAISVNECDPLRDEGIAFHRLLMDSGVPARCRQVMGACHGIELLPAICPDIAHSTASDIANFAIGQPGGPRK
jgi:acetyl esterase/lipase